MSCKQRRSKWFLAVCSALALSALLLAGCIQAQNSDGSVNLHFALKAGDEEVVCGKSYAGIGSDPVTVEIKDARLYISNVQLINAQGQSVPLVMADDGKWQNAGVALLDFEDGSAACGEIGNPDLNTEVVGTVPAGFYNGLTFDLGIPFEQNHQDVVAAASPLNVPALWWNWQYGYKFARIDLDTDAPAPDNQYFIHLGSTGCGEAIEMDMSASMESDEESPIGTITETAESEEAPMDAITETAESEAAGGMDMSGMGTTPPAESCNNPNIVTVKLTGFDPTKSVIVADLAALLTAVDLKHPVPQPAGCMSGVDDPDCQTLMPNFGLSLADGQCLDGCAEQRFFRLE